MTPISVGVFLCHFVDVNNMLLKLFLKYFVQIVVILIIYIKFVEIFKQAL